MDRSRDGFWRAATWASLPAGFAVFAKTLVTPFSRDDLLQRAMALGTYPSPRGLLDLYDFVRPSERDGFVATGALPWWTADALSVRFFRPLASAILYVEHRFIRAPLAMHVHSFVWWIAAVLAAIWLFRMVHGQRGATIAAWIFALAPCHAPALAFVAQREVLIATTFGVLGIGVLVRSNERSARGAYALFAASLAAGEYGLCFGGYVLAWALTRKTTPERLRACLPFAIPAALYVGLRAVLGYGTTGTGFYRDPFHAPWQFLSHAPRSLLVLWADAWTSLDTTSWPLACLVLMGAALVGLVLWLPKDSPSKWLVGGSLLAAIPLLASVPAQRLIGPLFVGVAASLGAVIASFLAKPLHLLRVGAVGAILALHGAFALRSSWLESRALSKRGAEGAARTASLVEHLRGHDESTVIVALGSWESAFCGKAYPSTPSRAPWRVLVTARHALMLRVDAYTVDVIVPVGQGFFPLGADDIFRAEDDPLSAGDTRDVPGMRATVLSDGTSGPPRVRFTFDRSLDDRSYVWLSESRAAYNDAPPPATGFGRPLSP